MADRPFKLVDYFPYCRIGRNTGNTAWEIDPANSQGSWTTLATANQTASFLWSSKLDVAGWTKEGMTAFFANMFLQRPLSYSVSQIVDPTTGGMSLRDIIIVSDVPLDDIDTPVGTRAGFPRAQSDYMTIKFAEGTQRVQTTSAPNTFTMNDSWQFGSAEPTASGTLYLYRYIDLTTGQPLPDAADRVDCPEIRWVAEGIATEEPEFVYLNRLRRSYELQQS